MPLRPCLDDDDFTAYVDGILTDGHLADVEAHLDECGSCRSHASMLVKVRTPSPAASGKPVDDAFVVGERIGRFQVQRRLGEGAMGVVYLARDDELHREVAIKLIRPQLWSKEGQELLRQEARAMAQLAHPNIVTVFEIGRVEEEFFLAMEYVPGTTLRAWLQAEQRSWVEILGRCIEAGRGLAAAHAAGMVHRDFKPDNILCGDDGRTRVTDFGLARLTGQAHEGAAPRLQSTGLDTRSGLLVGTPAYMAPEQLSGRPATAASDQYSYCVTVHEALYGFRPGDSPAGAKNALPPLPKPLHRALMRGLSPSPGDRFTNLDELLSKLQAVVRPRPLWSRRTVLLPTFLALGLVAGWFSVWKRERPVPCQLASRKLATVWNDDFQRQLRESIVARGFEGAGGVADEIALVYSKFAQRWTEANDAACTALLEGAQSNVLVDLRVACLDDRLDEARLRLELLLGAPSGDLPQFFRKLDVTLSVPEITSCADGPRILAAPPKPTGVSERAALARIETQLREAALLTYAGRTDEAQVKLSALEKETDALTYEPARIERLLLEGKLAGQKGQTDRSVAWFREAVKEAASAGLPVLEARGWLGLMSEFGLRQRHAEIGLELGFAAHSSLRRQGDQETEARVLNTEGRMLANMMRWNEALLKFEAAQALANGTHGPTHPLTLALNGDSANAAAEFGQLKKGEARLRTTIDAFTRNQGVDGPARAEALLLLAGLLSRQGRHLEARDAADEALRIRQAIFGHDAPTVGQYHLNLARVLLELDDVGSAQRHLQRSLEIAGRRNAHTAEMIEMFVVAVRCARKGERLEEANAKLREARELCSQLADQSLCNLDLHLEGALTLETQNRCDLALPVFMQAVTRFEQAMGAGALRLAAPLLGVGRCLIANQKPAEAIAPLRRALVARNVEGLDPKLRAQVSIQLARALWLSSQDRSEARGLADEALSVLSNSRDPSDKLAVRNWLRDSQR